jgi:hypothetical protein
VRFAMNPPISCPNRLCSPCHLSVHFAQIGLAHPLGPCCRLTTGCPSWSSLCTTIKLLNVCTSSANIGCVRRPFHTDIDEWQSHVNTIHSRRSYISYSLGTGTIPPSSCPSCAVSLTADVLLFYPVSATGSTSFSYGMTLNLTRHHP